ncbi:MAG: hypothetical protein LUE98_09450 [Tannerellaceae bacterium]|nr:hypothetical protein [Tannerellaceae bacterium]
MIKWFIAAIAVYYIVLFWKYRKNITEIFKKRKRPIVKQNAEGEKVSVDFTGFVGKSHFSILEKPEIIEEINVQDIENNPPVEVDMEEEEEPEKEFPETEESYELEDKEPMFAQGVSFDELSQMANVLTNKETSEQEEIKAVRTIIKMGSSELSESMVSQIDESRDKIEKMLFKYQNSPVLDTPEIHNSEIASFSINDYL